MWFNPNVTYEKAIQNKNIGVLRALLTGIIGSDPTFATDEFDEAKDYILNKSRELNGREIELEEEYVKQEDEYEIDDKSQWDEHYFRMQLVWLRDNFSLERRLPHIKEMGEYVYRNKVTLGKVKAENRKKEGIQEPPRQKENTPGNEASSVMATGDDRENKRLFDSFADWAKDHWYIILVFLVVAITFFAYKVLNKGCIKWQKQI